MKYEDRLRACKLPTLYFRRIRGDMIETFKMVTGIYAEMLSRPGSPRPRPDQDQTGRDRDQDQDQTGRDRDRDQEQGGRDQDQDQDQQGRDQDQDLKKWS